MIYLLRHGDAEPDLGDGDAARRLTPKGEEQARLAGLAIARLGYGIDACLTSPRVRAWAAISRSLGPIGVPTRSRWARSSA